MQDADEHADDLPAREPTPIRTIGEHKGVGLHDHQPAARLRVVRKAIDHVLGLDDVAALYAYANDWRVPPEARLLAEGRCEAMLEQLTADRTRRPQPHFSLADLAARCAGLGCEEWRDHEHFCSILDWGGARPGRPVRRDKPLRDADG